jgi:hypothetical protein
MCGMTKAERLDEMKRLYIQRCNNGHWHTSGRSQMPVAGGEE